MCDTGKPDEETQKAVDETINEAAAKGNKLAQKMQKLRVRDKRKGKQ